MPPRPDAAWRDAYAWFDGYDSPLTPRRGSGQRAPARVRSPSGWLEEQLCPDVESANTPHFVLHSFIVFTLATKRQELVRQTFAKQRRTGSVPTPLPTRHESSLFHLLERRSIAADFQHNQAIPLGPLIALFRLQENEREPERCEAHKEH
jgi:hypothetical protein